MKSTLSTKALRLLSILLAFSLVAVACGDDESAKPAESSPTTEEDPAPEDDPALPELIKVGILGECEGPFGGFHEDVVGGVVLAMVNFAGATSNSTTSALEGFSGASINGVPIELVGIACGDDSPDRATQEVRELVEQNGADIVFGPLSGDEGIAVANYAKDHPEVTFLNGASAAQDTTLKVGAENFFRFGGDGAQWNAGLGLVAREVLGWETAAIVVDDYSFGWTSAAGFVAEFCAVGGNVVSRVFPPLGTADYSPFIEQLPDSDEVDGYFWATGGIGPAMQAFINSKGDIDGAQHVGNFFLTSTLADAVGTDIAGAYTGSLATVPGLESDVLTDYLTSASATWDTLPSGFGPDAPSVTASLGFFYTFYANAAALLTALDTVGGNLDDNHAALRSELATLSIDPGFGQVQLDENRNFVGPNAISQIILNDDGTLSDQTVAIIPQVDQTFGGTFDATTEAPGRDSPGCEARDLPWAADFALLEN